MHNYQKFSRFFYAAIGKTSKKPDILRSALVDFLWVQESHNYFSLSPNKNLCESKSSLINVLILNTIVRIKIIK